MHLEYCVHDCLSHGENDANAFKIVQKMFIGPTLRMEMQETAEAGIWSQITSWWRNSVGLVASVEAK